MPRITSESVAAASLSRGTQEDAHRIQDKHKITFAPLDKAPFPHAAYFSIGESLFIPKGSAKAIAATVYQSKDGKDYCIRMADRHLAPVRMLAEEAGMRRVFGLANEWRLGSDGDGGFAMKRDGGHGPGATELRQLAGAQPWRSRLHGGAPTDPLQIIAQWAADPQALQNGEDRAGAKVALERALQQESDPVVTSYRLGLGNFRLTDLPTEVLNGLTKCFELSVNTNRLTSLSLNNPHMRRVLARNNRIEQLDLGMDMTGLQYTDLANNLLDTVPACLNQLPQTLKAFVTDNPLSDSAISAHNTKHAAQLVAVRPRQTRQDLKRLDSPRLVAALEQTDRAHWDTFLSNLSHPQRDWLFHHSPPKTQQALKAWLDIGDDDLIRTSSAVSPQALACYANAMGGHQPECERKRQGVLKVMRETMGQFDNSVPGDAEKRGSAMLAMLRDATGTASSMGEQLTMLGILLDQLPHLSIDDVHAAMDELQRLTVSDWMTVSGKVQDLLKQHYGRNADLLRMTMRGGVVTKDHDAGSVFSAGCTAYLRLLDYELAQRGVEQQLLAIWDNGNNQAAWLYLTHFKQTLQTIFESAEVLAAGKRRADMKVELSGLGASGTEGTSVAGGTSSAVEVAAEVSSDVLKAFPVLSLAGSLTKLGLEQRATLKYQKEGERIRHQLDRSADTHDLFADTLARAMTTLRMDELRKAETRHGKSGKGQSFLQRLPDSWEARLRRMGAGSSVDPKEPALERAMREMATEDARSIVEAMIKGRIDMPLLKGRPFGTDAGKLAPVLHWYGQTIGMPDTAIDKVLEATPWGVLDAQVTRDELKEKYQLQLTWPRTPSSQGSGTLSRKGVKIDDVQKLIQLESTSLKQVIRMNRDEQEEQTGKAMQRGREELTREFDAKLEKVAKEAGRQVGEVDAKTEKVDAKVEKVDAKTEEMRTEIGDVRTDMTNRIDTVEGAQTNIDERIDQQTGTINDILQDVDTIGDDVADLEADLNGKADQADLARLRNTVDQTARQGAQALQHVQAAIHAKADAAHVMQQIAALTRQLTREAGRLQGELGNKADAGRTAQRLTTLTQQINRNLANLQQAVNAKADAAQIRPPMQALRQQLQQLQGELQRKADAGRVTQQINGLVQQLNQNFTHLQAALNNKADAAQVTQQFQALGGRINQNRLQLGNLQAAVNTRADAIQTTQRFNAVNQQVRQLRRQVQHDRGTLGGLRARVQQTVHRNDLAELEEYTNALAETQTEQLQDTIDMMDDLHRQITGLQTENRQLRQALADQQRHSARIEVRANLTRLTPAQALQSLQVLFATDNHPGSRRNLTRNNEGVFTHVVTWSGLRRSLASLLQRAQGYTLQELSAFLARQGIAVTDTTLLDNAVFMVLDIAEPPRG